jgi:hypothetical protein
VAPERSQDPAGRSPQESCVVHGVPQHSTQCTAHGATSRRERDEAAWFSVTRLQVCTRELRERPRWIAGQGAVGLCSATRLMPRDGNVAEPPLLAASLPPLARPRITVDVDASYAARGDARKRQTEHLHKKMQLSPAFPRNSRYAQGLPPPAARTTRRSRSSFPVRPRSAREFDLRASSLTCISHYGVVLQFRFPPSALDLRRTSLSKTCEPLAARPPSCLPSACRNHKGQSTNSASESPPQASLVHKKLAFYPNIRTIPHNPQPGVSHASA